MEIRKCCLLAFVISACVALTVQKDSTQKDIKDEKLKRSSDYGEVSGVGTVDLTDHHQDSGVVGGGVAFDSSSSAGSGVEVSRSGLSGGSFQSGTGSLGLSSSAGNVKLFPSNSLTNSFGKADVSTDNLGGISGFVGVAEGHQVNTGTVANVRTHEVRTITKHVPVPVPQPYPVTVTKEVRVPEPYPVPVTRTVQVPVRVQVPVEVPKPYPVNVPHPVPVPVQVRVPVEVPKPYAVHITKTVPVPVEKPIYIRIPHPISVPVNQPYPVPVPQTVAVRVPHPVVVRVPEIVGVRQDNPSFQISSSSSSFNSGSNFNLGAGWNSGTGLGESSTSIDSSALLQSSPGVFRGSVDIGTGSSGTGSVVGLDIGSGLGTQSSYTFGGLGSSYVPSTQGGVAGHTKYSSGGWSKTW